MFKIGYRSRRPTITRTKTSLFEVPFNQISEILAQPTVELAGPLPSAIQNYTQFAPGIVTGSSQTDAARALVTFLSSPAAQTVLKTKGFE
jgi:molybdate transport system substrate-binding protein